MDELSNLLLYVVVGVPALVVGIYLLAFVLALGPVGLFAVAFLVLGAMAVRSWGDDPDAPIRTNCSACGAPNAPDRDGCKHCDASLGAGGDN